MPTPVSTARQCLTPEAAHALDEAVSVARRRSHGQTTSLHAVSALLALPSSTLREACARARNAAYSPRLQFKALELCLGVSLDRVASTQVTDDPPVSNSLMAAIKRSQANQRRQPENYHLYHQLHSQSSSISCVKVELQHLILSILDDPVVSRVFAEAGFRSSEIKLAVLRPFPQLRHHPVFLTNPDPGPGRRRPNFPFSGFPDGDDNSRRIGEILGRTSRGRNPLLVGVCAYDALQSFMQSQENVYPAELSGLSSVCIEKDVSKFMKDCDKGCLNSRLGEVGLLIDQSSGPGVVVSVGDLKTFVAEDSVFDSVSYVVERLAWLLEVHGGKVWLIGATASYGSYLKFVNMFPSVEKDWDLQLLPITAHTPTSSMAESYPRSSLMDSFVPFGGFFSAPSDLKLPLSCSYPCLPCNQWCNEKCEQEVYAVSKRSFTASVGGQHQASLPSWMQTTAHGPNKGLDMKTKDVGVLLSSKVADLQKQWDETCQHLHQSHPQPLADLFPTIVGFKAAEGKDSDSNISFNENSCIPKDGQDITKSHSNVKSDSISSEVWEKPSKCEAHESGNLKSSCSLSNLSVVEGSRASPTSSTSVTTDLGLGMCSSPSNEQLKPLNLNREIQQESGFSSSNVNLASENPSTYTAQSSVCSSPNNHGPIDPSDVKMLFRVLFGRVGWQTEAASAISQRIAHCRTRSEHRSGARHRRDIWFNFTGPDRYGKKKIALVLAEVLYGSREQFIHVDMNSQDGVISSGSIFGCQVKDCYDAKFRGKTVVDYIAGELSKKPLSIVFLENVDKADLVAQNSLSQAILTGKFPDTHGRQVSTNNAVFITTSEPSECCSILTSAKGPSNYSEEIISLARGWPVQITVEYISSNTCTEGVSGLHFLNKRKLLGAGERLEQHEVSDTPKRANKMSTRYLDLNLPAEENAPQQLDYESSENDCISRNSRPWLQEFINQMDETVAFKPVDFDTLDDNIQKEVKNCFTKFVGSPCLLEIDTQVMERLLAAVYFSDNYRVVETWVEEVLSRAFAEVRKKYALNAHVIVKLKACEGISLVEDSAPKDYLPPRIILK